VTSVAYDARRGPGRRFSFGTNWQRFLAIMDAERIGHAARSLRGMLPEGDLAGRSFLDVGCGSGLFSLAAATVGAERIHSFDCDADSVACTRELLRRYRPSTSRWTIEQGDVLDPQYVRGLGTWHVVYAWGVVHHSGQMWHALDNVVRLVADDGVLVLAVYNDQGLRSRLWRQVKRLHNAGDVGRALVLATFVPYFVGRGVAADLLRIRNPLTRYRQYERRRGMSVLHDILDWLGGYPFEVARPEEIVRFCGERGLPLERLTTAHGGLGCNEFVFRKGRRR
jgi:predicted RNA methylase